MENGKLLIKDDETDLEMWSVGTDAENRLKILANKYLQKTPNGYKNSGEWGFTGDSKEPRINYFQVWKNGGDLINEPFVIYFDKNEGENIYNFINQ